jgi:hypothetical protein
MGSDSSRNAKLRTRGRRRNIAADAGDSKRVFRTVGFLDQNFLLKSDGHGRHPKKALPMLPAASKQPMTVSVFDPAELVGFGSPEAACGCTGGIASKHVGIDQAIIAQGNSKDVSAAGRPFGKGRRARKLKSYRLPSHICREVAADRRSKNTHSYGAREKRTQQINLRARLFRREGKSQVRRPAVR